MVLSSSISLGVRYHSVKLSAKSFTPGTFNLLRNQSRMYSSLLQQARYSPRLLVTTPTGAHAARNFWWGSSASKPPSAIPQPPSEVPTSTPEPVHEFASTTAAAPPAPLDIPPATPVDVAGSVDPSLVADPSVLSAVPDVVAAHAPILYQWGEMAALGLTNWTPAGIVRMSMEYIHLGLDLPWFWTIVAGTVFWRLVTIPFLIKGMRASAALLPIQSQITALQQRVSAAYATRNTLELQQASLAMKEVYRKAGVSPFSALVSVVQIPATLGVFFGVKTMCDTLEAVKWSGFALIPDLSAADPTYVLPLLFTAAIHLQLLLGVREIDTKARPDMGHVMNGLRFLTIPGFFVTMHFSSGLLVSLLVTAGLTSLQSALLRVPAIRSACKIPAVAPEHQGKLPSIGSTIERIKEFIQDPMTPSFKEKVEEARREAAKRERNSR